MSKHELHQHGAKAVSALLRQLEGCASLVYHTNLQHTAPSTGMRYVGQLSAPNSSSLVKRLPQMCQQGSTVEHLFRHSQALTTDVSRAGLQLLVATRPGTGCQGSVEGLHCVEILVDPNFALQDLRMTHWWKMCSCLGHLGRC
jgi:hypothetical protein